MFFLMRRMSVGALPTCCTHKMKLINQKTMKKISLQTKLEECSVPKRYIDVIKREAEDIRIIFDLVSLTRPDFMRIRIVGKRFLSIWQEFLEEYGLHLGMTVKEILQYDPDGILQYDPDSGKLQYKLISSLNCNPESNIDRSKSEKFDPKTLNLLTKYWQEIAIMLLGSVNLSHI